ncbi:hypothetical protein GOBAR_AA28546 [Gossypium barbadense]|uniref:Uncharacterized protein n=1 Tax=Gossypium barbadense TaxID=3634 RepID=A0A2P5WM37_GOSBA|nr:hypothetical protein GOBAR_AA28546 [Gossypium barbadense]
MYDNSMPKGVPGLEIGKTTGPKKWESIAGKVRKVPPCPGETKLPLLPSPVPPISLYLGPLGEALFP